MGTAAAGTTGILHRFEQMMTSIEQDHVPNRTNMPLSEMHKLREQLAALEAAERAQEVLSGIYREKHLPFWDNPITLRDEETQALYEEHKLTDLSRTKVSAWAVTFLREEDTPARRQITAQILMGRVLHGSRDTDPDYAVSLCWGDLKLAPDRVVKGLELCAITEDICGGIPSITELDL